ncbi:MAG TPA: hypothetical protein VHF25_00825 [Nitriliruptorales bacterium]|nr:hypothetical protein [Nitriliruptorales bacterium]
MDDAIELAEQATSVDPEVGLRAVASLRLLADRLEELQVDRARALGWTWQRIADALGVSKQAVHKKHRRRAPRGRGGRR